MVLSKIKDLAYPLLYTLKIMETHFYDGLMSCTLYTRHILFSPFLYYDSTRILISLYLVSTLIELHLSSYTDFPLIAMLLAKPQPGSGISPALRDTSSVVIKS
jgi:hypothetical protein